MSNDTAKVSYPAVLIYSKSLLLKYIPIDNLSSYIFTCNLSQLQVKSFYTGFIEIRVRVNG